MVYDEYGVWCMVSMVYCDCHLLIVKQSVTLVWAGPVDEGASVLLPARRMGVGKWVNFVKNTRNFINFHDKEQNENGENELLNDKSND
jgi:hypothetical protein